MKNSILKVAEHLENGTIGSDKARSLLLNLFGISGSLLEDWQAWEDCILSFLRTYPKVREDFNKHVDDWNTHTPLPPSAYERVEQ